jgi:hypothetical protein
VTIAAIRPLAAEIIAPFAADRAVACKAGDLLKKTVVWFRMAGFDTIAADRFRPSL